MGPRESKRTLGGGARRGTQGPFGRGMGPFGFIPKPFRMVSYSEAIPNGSYPEASPMVTNSEASPNGKVVPNG